MASIPGWQDLWEGQVGADPPLAPVLCSPLPPAQAEQARRALHKTRTTPGG